MKPLTTVELLNVWDETAERPLIEKILRLLAKACSADHIDQVSQLSIGDRDARLLKIREWIFGNILRNKVNCPKCGEVLEWESDTSALHLQTIPADLASNEFSFEKDDYTIKFRLPNSLDVFQMTEKELSENSYQIVISKCILSIKKNQKECNFNDLPLLIIDSLNDYMSLHDPQADIKMQLVCPCCDHSWGMYFDIGSYLWDEINNWARKILQEVYILARTFSWSEKEILTMTPHRRRMYLDMIQK